MARGFRQRDAGPSGESASRLNYPFVPGALTSRRRVASVAADNTCRLNSLPGHEGLAVFRAGRSRDAQRRAVHPDRQLPNARRRALRLSQGRAGAPAHHGQPPSRPTNAVQLAQGAPARPRKSRLIFLRHPANRSSYQPLHAQTGGPRFTAYGTPRDAYEQSYHRSQFLPRSPDMEMCVILCVWPTPPRTPLW